MKQNYRKLISALFGIPLLLISTISLGENASVAPAWQLKTQSGNAISLADYKGKPVILHFWATWCPYCKKQQPQLVAYQKNNPKQDIKIVAISINEDAGAKPQDSIIERGFDVITAVDGDDVARMYGVRGTPTTFFINRAGKVVARVSSSAPDSPEIEFAVDAMLDE